MTSLNSDSGTTIVEYALLLSLIAIVAVPAISRLGSSSRDTLTKANHAISEVVDQNDIGVLSTAGDYGEYTEPATVEVAVAVTAGVEVAYEE